MKSINRFFTFSLLVLAFSACNKDDRYAEKDETPNPTPVFDWSVASDSAQVALNTQYWSTAGKYYNQNNDGHVGFNYWWNAHALDVLVDGYERTGDAAYLPKMEQLLDGIYQKNGNKWFNNFYDDMEWLALASLRAYKVTNNTRYKKLTDTLWVEIKKGWTNVNGGGIMWEKNSPNSKNACSNAPAMILAARLYKLNGVQDDLNWAKKIYTWQKASLVEPARGIVWDGYNNFNETAVYTYNQGTWLGGALELYTITNESTYLYDAVRNANYVVNDRVKFSPDGILKGENTGDGGLFKGIFMRYLTQLVILGNVDAYTKDSYLKYLKANGQSLLEKATLRPGYLFGHDWRNKPANRTVDCSVHLSALMQLECVALLKKMNLIQ